MSTFNPFSSNKNAINTNNPSIFQNNNTTNNTPSLFSNIQNNTTQTNNIFSNLQNNQNNQNIQGNIFSQPQNTLQQNNNILNNNQKNNNILNNNQQNNNILNNNQQNNNLNLNNFINLDDQNIQRDKNEYDEALNNVIKCWTSSEKENMFKDYVYTPIPKGKSPEDYHKYKPFYVYKNNEIIINDYNIWEEGNKNNKNPNEMYTDQIASVNSLLTRNKYLEKSILKNIAQTIENEKNLEDINKKIDEDMNSKLLDIKNHQLKVDELEIDLSSKIAQYNYLAGAAQENVSNTQEIKENLKKTYDIINRNKILEFSEKIKQPSNENIGGENKNYIKDMSQENINGLLDSLVEIQNMMKIIYNNSKKNLDIITGIQKEADKIL